MMTPTERRLEILAVLQAWPGITAPQLADRLSVSERTARRDVAHLRRIGYGIEGEAGRYGGYVLSRGARLPPLVLDSDEAAAVALGLASDLGVTGLELAAGTALAKVTETAPARARSTLQALGSAVRRQPTGRRATSHRVLLTLANACRQGAAVQLRQRPVSGGLPRRITVQPHQLVKVGQVWYLVGWPKDGSDWSLYALERIDRTDPLGTRLSTPPPPQDAGEFARSFLSSRPRRHFVRVRLHTSADLARELVNPATGTIADEGSSCVLSLQTDDLDWAARYLVYLNVDFDVLSPAELTSALHDLGSWLARRHV
jgi:predicted DNA-binding transcriptional regulator YafY